MLEFFASAARFGSEMAGGVQHVTSSNRPEMIIRPGPSGPKRGCPVLIDIAPPLSMARTKPPSTTALTPRQKERAAERAELRRTAMKRAARLASPHDLKATEVMQQTHATSDSEEGSETEPEEDTFSMPEPEQVIKLSAQVRGASGMLWKGRVRGGGNDIFLERSWVRNNFGRYVWVNSNSRERRAATHAGARLSLV